MGWGCVGKGGRRVVAVCALLVLLPLLAEVFVFNYHYWLQPLGQELELASSFKVDADSKTFEFSGIDAEVDNVYVGVSSASGDCQVTCTLFDEGNAEGYQIPSFPVSAGDDRWATIHPYGALEALVLDFDSEDPSFSAQVSRICLNKPYPFEFNVFRYAVVAALTAFCWLFRPSSFLYRMSVADSPALAKRASAGLVAVVGVVMLTGVVLNPSFVGISTPQYNADSWEEGGFPVQTRELGWSAHSQYAELARSFASGSLALQEEPPSFMEEIENPYAPERAEAAERSGESLRNDVAYYQGSYYVYFGVLPVLVFYLPFYLCTGVDLPTFAPVFASLLLYAAAVTFLVWTIVRNWFKKTSLGVYLLVVLCALLGSQTVYAVSMPTFYFLPIVLGLACGIQGISLYLSALGGSKGVCARVAVGSVLVACTLACRPQLILFAAFALPVGVALLVRTKSARGRARLLVAAFVPLAIVFCLVGWYNFARFGNPFDFGANYNLTYNDMRLRSFSIEGLVPGLFAYLAQPPVVTVVFPFLQPTDLSNSYGGISITQPMFGGLLWAAPFVWLSIGAWLLPRSKKSAVVKAVACAGLCAAVVLFAFDALGAGILTRYFLDAAPFAVLASVPVCLAWEERASSIGRERPASHSALVAFLLIAFLVSLSHSSLVMLVGTEGGYTLEGLDFLRDSMQFWV